jgi:hypothetical protein
MRVEFSCHDVAGVGSSRWCHDIVAPWQDNRAGLNVMWTRHADFPDTSTVYLSVCKYTVYCWSCYLLWILVMANKPASVPCRVETQMGRDPPMGPRSWNMEASTIGETSEASLAESLGGEKASRAWGRRGIHEEEQSSNFFIVKMF